MPAGTPVQNNMRELFGILNLLDPQRFGGELGQLARVCLCCTKQECSY